MANRYIYQRTGGPLVTWDHASGRPPGQARGADAVSLGSLGGSSLDIEYDGRPLPRPGAPEYLGDVRAAGRIGSGVGSQAMGCGGSCGCGGKCAGMGNIYDDLGPVAQFAHDNALPLAAGAAAIYYFFFRKKRR